MNLLRRVGKSANGKLQRACTEQLETRVLLANLTIPQENQLAGTPESQWDINGIGDPNIQGFATDISVNRGSTVQFKVDDTPGAFYHIDIYRMGYYQGNGARKVTTIPSSQTSRVNQPNPVIDNSTGLIDCGNWSVTASWAVPADATSGIYFGKVVREDTGGACHIIFVVRNDASTSNLIMQTSDTTWQAYNEYGGTSLYKGSGPGGGPAPGRAYKVSYNRPFNNRAQEYGYGPQSWVFYNEYPMVRFLEQNGYDVSYQSGVDTDRFGSLLQNHKVFVSAGHDEYWSGGQRNAVDNARNAGVNLSFFSGNLMYWKTRYENSIAGPTTSFRTLVCYKESLIGAKIDPSPTWTGLWRDARFSPPSDGGRPENQTTGGFGYVDRGPNNIGTDFEVPDWAGKFRMWRNTNLTNLASGTSASVGDSVLGYEWDIDSDNGFRPNGLIDLSKTTQNVSEILSYYGTTTAPGVATHTLTLYRAPSGALVFGAATVQWAWGLDANHDGTASDGHAPAADSRMRQGTVNLFADMGVQPATLAGGIVAATKSTDTVGPSTSITIPPNNILITQSGFATISGTSTDTGGGLVAGVEVSIDGGATWHPATGRTSWSYSWSPTTLGAITIRARSVDDTANIGATASANLTLQQGSGGISIWPDTTLPGTQNDADASAIEVGVKFRSDVAGFISGLRFFKGSQNTGTHTGHLWTTGGTLLATVNFTNETASGWQTATLSSPVQVNANTTYVASYFTSVGHYASDNGYFLSGGVDRGTLHALADGVDGGNGVYRYGSSGFPNSTYQGSNYWVDVVFNNSGADVTPPTVIAQTPAPGATGVPRTTTVTATFSEAIQSSTLSFVLRDSSNNTVPAGVSYNPSTRVATLTPSSQLNASTTYTATVTGAKDSAGNTMVGSVVWSFTTAATTGTTNSIWPGNPTPQLVTVDDFSPVELGVKFRSDIAGSITGIRFHKGLQNTGTHTGTLWSAAGAQLGTLTFSGETASGWQQASFSSPINIAANTTYIASYHTGGGYSADEFYFDGAGTDTQNLHALADGVDGGNGVYKYGAASAFPGETYQSSNYWVDIVFSTTISSDTTPPVITNRSPANGATGVSRTTTVTATFSEAIQSSTLSFVLRNTATSALVNATVSYNATTRVATLTPSSQLAEITNYTATVSGAQDLAGNAMVSDSWSFITADTTRPTITARTPSPNATGVARSVKPTVTFSEPMNPSTINTSTFTLRIGTTTVSATVSYNATTRVATLTPSATLASNTLYTLRVIGGSSGVKDLAGNALLSTSTWSFTTGTSFAPVETDPGPEFIPKSDPLDDPDRDPLDL